MCPEKAANIDIAKHKELFEYEMTEVLLNLKGDFAAFSGKDTKFAESSVAEERLIVPAVSIPDPSPVAVHVEISAQSPNTAFDPRRAESKTVPVKIAPVKQPVLPQPAEIETSPVSVRLPEYAVPEIKCAGFRGPDQIHVAVPVLPQMPPLSPAKPSAAPVRINVPSLPDRKPVFGIKAGLADVKLPSVRPVPLSSFSLQTRFQLSSLMQKKAEMPVIPDTAPVVCPALPGSEAFGQKRSSPLTAPLLNAAWDENRLLPEKLRRMVPAVSAGPVKKPQIAVPLVNRPGSPPKLSVRAKVMVPELPDLSVPAAPEIDI